VERERGLEIAKAFHAASRSGDMTTLGALLAQDVSIHTDGGGKRPAAPAPILGYDRAMQWNKALAILYRKFGSQLVQVGFVNGLPGFVTREGDGELQTTALEIEDGKVTAIYVMRNPDKLRHLH
jgi:RNA polymerase sigma-70 factor (ECF subfamily)